VPLRRVPYAGVTPVIAIGPEDDPELRAAVEAGGGSVGALEEADGLVWSGHDPGALPELPGRVRWVQLPSAGVEHWIGHLPDGPQYTSATGAFGLPVAEHALALLLALARRIPEAARASEWEHLRPGVRSLEGAMVAIVGAGGIGRALIELLAPLHARVLAVTRRGHPVPGAERTVPADRMEEVLREADHVVLAAPGGAGTEGMIGAQQLAWLPAHAHLVNVGRGSLLDTDALVAALEAGRLAAAALDVTDPEPLPAGHPLWSRADVLITPHVATPPEAERRHIAARVRDNVERLGAGEPLLGLVDLDAGY
jgi:D-3-phosphoglycerate dehydrogenase